MGLTIYFLRHGETEASQSGAFAGLLDVELTPEGHRMAEDFASAYKALSWAAVFSSPLRRATDTAQPLCDALADAGWNRPTGGERGGRTSTSRCGCLWRLTAKVQPRFD